MISQILKYIIFIIIFGISIYYYINHRNIGCRDKDAINYNSEINIHDRSKCIYKVPGCMDKEAPNHNIYANTSCKEDCTSCHLKGNCKLCENQVDCTNTCPECICKPKVFGCTRDWAINYDKNATIETNCISPDDILKKISIVSGGDCNRCSSRVTVRVNDDYPIIGGNYGINLLVLERTPELKIRHNRTFSTGNYEIENKKFVDFMKRYVFYKDIVIIAVRGDATGRKRSYAWEKLGEDRGYNGDKLPDTEVYTSLSLAKKACLENESKCIGINELTDVENVSEKKYYLMPYTSKEGFRAGYTGYKRNVLFLDRILTDESKKILETLGARNPDINREGSYILIGSYLNDIYYESYSANSDSYFPYFDFENYGCMNVNHPYFDKIKLDPTKYKMLANTGDEMDLNLNRVDIIYRCAQEAIRLGYRVFSVNRLGCYVYKLKDKFKEDSKYDVNNYFSNKKFLSYRDINNKNVKVGIGKCNVNYNLQPYGNNYDESFYYIKDVYYSGLFSMFYNGKMVQLYSASEYNGFRRDLGVGIHQAVSTISLSPRAINGKLYIPISSLKIPNGFNVTLFRNIYKDEDLTKFNSYRLSNSDEKVNFFNLNLSNKEGVKINCMDNNGKEIREVGYRIWSNIIKNLKINNNEETVKIYIYNRPIEDKVSELSIPCSRYGVIVPGWYQDTRFNQQNQCVAPKGKKCCNTNYSQGSKEGETVLLDGKIILNGQITFTREGNIFAPFNPTDSTWLDFKLNYPSNGDIYVLKGVGNNDIKVQYEVIGDTIRLSGEDNYSNKKLLTVGRDACNVDFENVRSSREVYEWIDTCKDNLDELTTTKWENIGINNAFGGDPIENTPIYYNLYDAKLGCMSEGERCVGINKTPENTFKLMSDDSKINNYAGYDAYRRSDSMIIKPEDEYGYDFVDVFDVRYYKEIDRLKNADYSGKVGYIELYDKNNEKTRQIKFNVWYHFWANLRFSSKESYFMVKVVDPEKTILASTISLEGVSNDEKRDNIIYKEYPSIVRDQEYITDIGYLIITKSNFGVTFYEEPEFKGLSNILTFGRYNLSNDLSFIIRSIKITDMVKCTIRLFLEYNFEVEYLKINHYVEEKNFKYSDLNKLFDDNVRIKSIIIDKMPFDNLISNNPDYEKYDVNKRYNKLEYPIAIKVGNYNINYLDTIYDIFKDKLTLTDNDKKILLIEETKFVFYISGFKTLKGMYINSGGGYGLISSIINSNNRQDVLNILNNQYGCIDTYDNTNHIRKIIYFGGKILGMIYIDGVKKFNYKSLSKLSFSKKEKYIIIKKSSIVDMGINIRNIMINRNTIDKKLEEIYGLIFNLEYDMELIKIPLAQTYTNLLQIPFINDGNRRILNTNFNIQIKDDYGNTTKYIKFYGQKYVIDYDINLDNSRSEINISKHEKYIEFNHRNEYDINDNYTFNYSTKINLRMDFISSISSLNISSKIQDFKSNILNSKGYLETRDSKNLIINKYNIDKKWMGENINKLDKLTATRTKDIFFNNHEFTAYYYNNLNELQMIFPVREKLHIDTVNEILNYYLYNQKCYIKLFNRSSDLVRIILTKQGKFLSFDERNKSITVDRYNIVLKSLYKNYNYLFQDGNWENAKDNIDINLDENKLSIQLENGVEIFMTTIDAGDIVLNYNQLNSHLMKKNGVNLTRNISNFNRSNIIVKDIDNNITKEINFNKNTLLFNMPIRYLELNNQDNVYRLMNNDTEVIKITLPEGMKGVYKYGDEENQIFVNKVVRESDIEAILYDEDNNIIQTTRDYDLHNYIFDVLFDNYIGRYRIEYYPKMNQWRLKLYEQDKNVNKIEIYNPKIKKEYDIRDVLGNITSKVNGNTAYIIENNYTNMKVINRDNTCKYYFGMGSF